MYGAAYGQHPNMLISDVGSPNEPSIMLNPANPAQIVAGANIDKLYTSLDSGRTWRTSRLSSAVHGVWGDPTILCDNNGDFYYFHLSNPPSQGSWIDRIVCQKSTSQGLTWTDGVGFGRNGSKKQDKHWPVLDPANNNIYVTWTEFDNYGSTAAADSSRILFARSTDAGSTWTAPRRINQVSGDCVDEDNTVEGAVPAVGPSGEIYVSWAGPAGIRFDRSFDRGDTWMDNDIFIDPMPTGWDMAISGIYRANGLPITVCDLSNSPRRGNIYVCWADQRNGANDTDVWFAHSEDNGTTWSAPIRVNDDAPGKQQFFPWMAIDQANGDLYFVFYDRRAYSNNLTDVYMARSNDGGQSFQNFKVSDTPFLPTSGPFFGDYNNLTVHNGVVRPIWTRLHNGTLSIWTALVNTALLSGQEDFEIDPCEEERSTLYPNPVGSNGAAKLGFKVRKACEVTLKVFNTQGQLIDTPILGQWMEFGAYIQDIDMKGQSSGIYICELQMGERVIRRKLVYDN